MVLIKQPQHHCTILRPFMANWRYSQIFAQRLRLSKAPRPHEHPHQCAGRQYHSYEHNTPPPFPPVENAILSRALAHVPTKGFHIDALTCGARDVGYRDLSVNLFPAGAFALVHYHLVTQRLAIGDSESPRNDQSGVATNIKKLVLARLLGNKPIIHRWQEVLILRSAKLACADLLAGACSHGHTIPSADFAPRTSALIG